MTAKALDAGIAGEPDGILISRAGMILRVRPVSIDDGPLLAEFFDRVDMNDLRFRFLSGQAHVQPHQIAQMLEVDHRRSEHFLAFDAETKQMVASAMLVADNHLQDAEVAIAIAKTHRGQGVGWTMLKYVADFARTRGVKRLRSIEDRQNRDALEVERTLGFSTSEYESDPTLLLVEACLD